ncbi:bifunctional folylpolyglutamate synthase/dihydrofolate synthase [Stakelama saccharophila]|uniref:Dihydrofolate synthase/folylpolyglutamate synthase n=1 Tax=Stakelama saccharophila TaxID=3075605 RepID=A0ABZ0BD22_9SPHN|nr:folylpolyglutamate synthase/dihydrofolate synthase family protein [Stakelama sp. W311]WNO54961.1 folylpolyglutamate synthase/dihydrofolate synthase family protein [Stakelama sp. W311]
MPDHAVSAAPAVQRQLDRLSQLGPGADILGLDRITRLLDRVGNPHRKLPPVFHVAGTNGKGSTCAFLRAALEADGKRVHVFTSPHLVRFNERIRLAGRLIDDDALAVLLEEVLDRGGDVGASFFEVTTTAAFLAFARTPADACVIEVGLGGRLDATNVVDAPAACGIAQLGIDHEAFLGNSLLGIAREKAGIAKSGSPLVTLAYPEDIAAAVREVAEARGTPLIAGGKDWNFTRTPEHVTLSDRHGTLTVPAPQLVGGHQGANLALALTMLRAQSRVRVSEAALKAAATDARWPARMQRLAPGPLTDRLPAGSSVWLDGGHNRAAAAAVSNALAERAGGARVHLILGMLSNKDAPGLLAPFVPLAESLTAIPVPGHDHHAPNMLATLAHDLGIAATSTAPDVTAAIDGIAAAAHESPPMVCILGSLYLAGEVLRENDECPD